MFWGKIETTRWDCLFACSCCNCPPRRGEKSASWRSTGSFANNHAARRCAAAANGSIMGPPSMRNYWFQSMQQFSFPTRTMTPANMASIPQVAQRVHTNEDAWYLWLKYSNLFQPCCNKFPCLHGMLSATTNYCPGRTMNHYFQSPEVLS